MSYIGAQISPWEGAILGERVPIVKYADFLPSSFGKTAEPIDLPFGLWTRLGRRKHKFNRVRQVAPMCPTTLCRELYENGWTDRFVVWVVHDSVGPKKAQVQSYSPGGANKPSWEAHWRHLANAIELSVCGGDAALCQTTLTICYRDAAHKLISHNKVSTWSK